MHIYAAIFDSSASKVLVSASSLESDMKKKLSKSAGAGGNVEAAEIIGKRVAEKAKKAGIDKVAFDRSGFRYHGRIKALAEAAREFGLKF